MAIFLMVYDNKQIVCSRYYNSNNKFVYLLMEFQFKYNDRYIKTKTKSLIIKFLFITIRIWKMTIQNKANDYFKSLKNISKKIM